MKVLIMLILAVVIEVMKVVKMMLVVVAQMKQDGESIDDDRGVQAVEAAKGKAAGGLHQGLGQLPEGSAVCCTKGEGCNQEI